MPQPTPPVSADLAPTGKLRAGINYGNSILVTKEPATGESRGVAVALIRELGRRLGAPVEIIAYQNVVTMVDAAKAVAWGSGLVARAIEQTGARRVSVAPAAPAR